MISRLPPEVVNQIAAGEVIERPASVVKELVENALDAGGRRVLVEIQDGGSTLVRVTDDGDGFLPEDLPLAFASHATSKLRALADLDHIASLGFRGEALASIGSVARCQIRSRRPDQQGGWQIRCDGGVQGEVQPCGCPRGTQIEVRDLFFHTPARRRFLKSPAAEKAKVQELLAELALARLDVDFTLLADGKEALRLPAGEPLAARFCRAYGEEPGRGLLPVERAFGPVQVSGVIGEPDLARRDGRLELLYVNGRLAGERSALFAVRQAYREFLMGGRFPIYVLQVALPPDQVDVNVHPRKAEVRFLESRRIAGALHATVHEALLARQPGGGGGGGVVVDPARPRARSGFPDLPPDLFARTDREPVAVPPAAATPPGAWQVTTPAPVVRETPPAQTFPSAPSAPPNPFVGVQRFLQVADLYVVLQGKDGILVVDQHALHERVVYERLQRAHRERQVRVQRLLVPAVLELLPADLEWLLAAAADLEAEGLLVQAIGPRSLAVHGVPAVLGKVDPQRLLQALLGDADRDSRPKLQAQVVERFHSMACRAAVMAGDRLGEAEIAALLQEAATLAHPHNCPHGRPTVLTFTTAELERYFRRRC